MNDYNRNRPLPSDHALIITLSPPIRKWIDFFAHFLCFLRFNTHFVFVPTHSGVSLVSTSHFTRRTTFCVKSYWSLSRRNRLALSKQQKQQQSKMIKSAKATITQLWYDYTHPHVCLHLAFTLCLSHMHTLDTFMLLSNFLFAYSIHEIISFCTDYDYDNKMSSHIFFFWIKTNSFKL